jgi:hypothetical protein
VREMAKTLLPAPAANGKRRFLGKNGS